MTERKNPFLALVLMLVPVLAFLLINLVVGAIIQIFYTPGIVARAYAEGVPASTMSNVEWMTEQLMQTSFPGVATIFVDLTASLIAFFCWKKIRRLEVPVKKALKPRSFGFMALLGLGIQGGLSLLLALAFMVLPESFAEGYEALSQGLTGVESHRLVMGLAVVFAAPLSEDLVMRGLSLNYGRKYSSDSVAIVVSSVAFGLMHLTNLNLSNFKGVIIQVIYAAMIGVILALVAMYFKTVWAGVFVHFIVNLSGQLLSDLSGLNPESGVAAAVFMGLGVVALVAAIILLVKKKIPSTDAETYGEMADAELVKAIEDSNS